MVKTLLAVGLTWALILPHGSVAQEPAADPELAKGIRQAQTGDLENAVLTLDAVAKRLAAQGGRARELARAYVYLSIAYLGLSQQQKAKAQFLEAWKMDKGMELSPREFPPKALQFFEQARKEAVEAEPAPAKPPATPSPKPAETQPTAASGGKRGGSKTPLVLLGLGGAAAAGVAVAVSAGSTETGGTSAPTPSSPPASRTISGSGLGLPATGALIISPVSFPSGSGTINGYARLSATFGHLGSADYSAFLVYPDRTSHLLSCCTGCVAFGSSTRVYETTQDGRGGDPALVNTMGKSAAGMWEFRLHSFDCQGRSTGGSFTLDAYTLQFSVQ